MKRAIGSRLGKIPRTPGPARCVPTDFRGGHGVVVCVHPTVNAMRFVMTTLFLACSLTSSTRAQTSRISFREHVAPILERRCLSCHNEKLKKGDLSLEDRSQLMGGEFIDLKSPADSPLLQLIRSDDGVAEMPKDADPLKASEVATIRQWIEAGALWPETVQLQQSSTSDHDWWSLQPLQKPVVPRDR